MVYIFLHQWKLLTLSLVCDKSPEQKSKQNRSIKTTTRHRETVPRIIFYHVEASEGRRARSLKTKENICD